MGMAREASAERRHRARGREVDGRRARETGNRIEAAVSRPQSIFFTAFLDYDFSLSDGLLLLLLLPGPGASYYCLLLTE